MVVPADLRAVVPGVATWATAGALVGAPGLAAPVAIGAGMVLVLAVVVVSLGTRAGGLGRSRSSLSVAILSTILVSSCAGAVAIGERGRHPAALQTALSEQGDQSVRLRLTRDADAGDRAWSARLVALIGAGRIAPREGTIPVASVPIRVIPSGDEAGRHIAAGAEVLITGTLRAAGAGDAAVAILLARNSAVLVAEPTGLAAWTDRARVAFTSLTASMPSPGSGLLRGLAIGDRSSIDPDLESAMQATALTHLTAVSGSNCAVLVGLVEFGGRLLRVRAAFRGLTAAGLLAVFVALVRPDPSIVRAAVMALVVLVAVGAGRRSRGLPLLAFAVVAMILTDPWVARTFAFTLSVLATGGLFVLVPRMTARLARVLPTPIAAGVAVPAAAQLACWPITVLLTPELPTFAIIANVLAEPFAPVATIAGLAACLSATVAPPIAPILALIAWVPAAAIALLAAAVASLPGATLPWPSAPLGLLIAAAGMLAAAIAVLARRAAVPAAIASVVLVVGVGLVGVPRLVLRGSVPDDWSVAMCDVGQGDATLLRHDGLVALIDTGRDDAMLAACLSLLGVQRIDLLVATHFDADHVGAASSIAPMTGSAFVGPTARPVDERRVRELTAAGVDVQRAVAGMVAPLGALSLHVLWPEAGDVVGGNDSSIVIAAVPAADCRSCISGLFLGDLGAAAQRELRRSERLAIIAPGELDLVKVSHHGSADQDPNLYGALAARVGLIGVGAENTYGHPTQRSLAMLAEAGTDVLRTDTQGTVVLAADGRGSFRVWSERSADAVAADPPRQPLHLHSFLPVIDERCHARKETIAFRRDSPDLVV